MRREYWQEKSSFTRQSLIFGAGASVLLSFYLSYLLFPYYRPYLRPETPHIESLRAQAWLLLLILPLWYVLLEHFGLFSRLRLPWPFIFWWTVQVQIWGLGALSVVIFALKLQTISRLLIFGFCALYIPVSMATRWAIVCLFEAHRSHRYNIPRILVIGSRERAKEFIRRVRSEEPYCEVIGCLDPGAVPATTEVEGVPLLGTTQMFHDYVFQNPVDFVVFAMPLGEVPNGKDLISAAMQLGLHTLVLPDFYIQRLGYDWTQPEVSIDSFWGFPAVALSDVPLETSYRVAKRVLDMVISASLLLLLAPLFALIAILIKLTSPHGRVFYRWKVLGVNKKPFLSYKFRTMVANAEQLKPLLLDQNEMQGPVFKMRNDPRVTPLGRFLRKYSLDELPQLYSVLKGDMSLVGPRPPGKEEVDRYQFWQQRKLSVKPGITCLWQVNGRNHIHSFDDWARLDLEYIQSASLWLDCKILLKTIPAVLRGRGAY